MDIVELFKDGMARVGASPVMWLMIGLSVVSVAVMLERAWFFHRIRVDIARLSSGLDERLRAHDLSGARSLLAASRSVEAAVAYVGLSEQRGIEAAREAMASATLRVSCRRT